MGVRARRAGYEPIKNRIEKLARVYHRVARLTGDRAEEVCDGGYIYIRRGRYEWRILDTRPKVP